VAGIAAVTNVVNPIGDRSRWRRVAKVVAWIAFAVAIFALLGVNEAVSVVALTHYADAQTATAFAVAQHLVGTAWSILFALILVTTVFGWTDGRALLKSAYADARHRHSANA
jgi:hypothetical protein